MSIIALNAKNFDVVTLQMHPKRMFSSSSSGTTGSIFVYAERSLSIKDQALPSGSQTVGSFSDDNIDDFRANIFADGRATTDYSEVYPTDTPPAAEWSATSSSFAAQVAAGSIYEGFLEYLSKVHNLVQSPDLKKQVEIIRFTPTNTFTSNTIRKSIIINNLFKEYRNSMPAADFGYTNYHTINFFTASSVSPNRALIYPSPSLRAIPSQGTFAITGSTNISFYINPRYTTPSPDEDFKAGVITHMSSCYAVSLHTGSGVDRQGFPNTFRIAFQLSSSADKKPSEINLKIANNKRSYPDDLIFVSEDHSLKFNHWHHVSIDLPIETWSGVGFGGTGSFWIDGEKQTASQFVVASASFNTPFYAKFNPLFIGNYYDGSNSGITSDLRAYFNSTAASVEGVEDWGTGFTDDPTATLLNHPLNAEMHDLRIYHRNLTDNEIITSSIKGPTQLQFQQIIKFYLPPFFTTDSTLRTVINTPFQAKKQKTEQPFNTMLSYDVNGKDINLQNFVREHRHHVFPRLFHLTCSEISDTTKSWQTANRLLYEFGVQSSYVKARNLTILPNDNGLFRPNFKLLLTQSDGYGLTGLTPQTPASSGTFIYPYRNDESIYDLSLITLRDMHAMPLYVTGTQQTRVSGDTAEIYNYIVQLTESGDWSDTAAPTTLLQTRDNSSDEICFFDASNLFYGQSIKKGAFSVLDKAITGSNTRVSIKLRDDNRGNIFRGDCATPQATWNSVGNIFYNEGVVIIKSPNLPFFGKPYG